MILERHWALRSSQRKARKVLRLHGEMRLTSSNTMGPACLFRQPRQRNMYNASIIKPNSGKIEFYPNASTPQLRYYCGKPEHGNIDENLSEAQISELHARICARDRC